MISIYNTVAARAEDFDGVTFNRVTGTKTISNICRSIAAAAGNHDEVSRLKRKLPAVTWQAYQERGTQRSAEASIANGLFILDIDHVDDPRALWERIKGELPKWEKDVVMVAHVTPSGKGLRIVAKRYNTVMTIAECQEVFCSHYQIECDKAVKDLSRLSFLVPRSYFLFLDSKVFEYEWELSAIEQIQQKTLQQRNNPSNQNNQNNQSNRSNQSNQSNQSNPSNQTSSLEGAFKGVSYKDLVSEVVERTGGVPVVGERNTRLYEIARIMRYTVDFNAQLLAQVLPSFGLPPAEVAQVAQSAVKSGRSERMPDTLYNILKDLRAPMEEAEEAETAAENEQATRQIEGDAQLPPVFKEYVAIAPHDFKVPTVAALLPVLGTLASTARARYLDGTYHSPSFITVVTAPQASGKSFARMLVNKCMAPLVAEDAKARLDEQQYRKALREAKNAKQQPQEPETVVRCVPASISVAKLLKRLDNAKGLHLFTFCEEIDTVAKSNSSGAWAQKTDIYRNAFDNAIYGQDYMTDMSYSATLEIFYNLLLLGTPHAVGRFFKDPEDGLVSRVCFTQIPDQFGAEMPVWGKMAAAEGKEVANTCRVLMERHMKPSEPRYYNLDYVNEEMNRWLLEQRDLAVLSMSRARDVARRRAAVIGFRAALLAVALADAAGRKCSEEETRWFARYIADIQIASMLSLYGDAMEKALTGTAPTRNRKFGANIFETLPETFSRNDLYTMMRKGGYSTHVRQAIYIWKRNGLIETIDKDMFRKKRSLTPKGVKGS